MRIYDCFWKHVSFLDLPLPLQSHNSFGVKQCIFCRYFVSINRYAGFWCLPQYHRQSCLQTSQSLPRKVKTVMSQVVFQLQARTRAGSQISAKSYVTRSAMHNGRNPKKNMWIPSCYTSALHPKSPAPWKVPASSQSRSDEAVTVQQHGCSRNELLSKEGKGPDRLGTDQAMDSINQQTTLKGAETKLVIFGCTGVGTCLKAVPPCPEWKTNTGILHIAALMICSCIAHCTV